MGTSQAADSPLLAQFRGCDIEGACLFWFERPGDTAPSLHRVHPRGIAPAQRGNDLRDRLNALLADMIHQHKRIELVDLRTADDGLLTATILVTGIDLVSDPQLQQLGGAARAP